jgi:hypothetical protein
MDVRNRQKPKGPFNSPFFLPPPPPILIYMAECEPKEQTRIGDIMTHTHTRRRIHRHRRDNDKIIIRGGASVRASVRVSVPYVLASGSLLVLRVHPGLT